MITMPDLSPWISSPADWAVLFVCAVLLGMSKTGIQGISTLAIPVMALTFGAKPSTGLILPMLCTADLIAVIYYRRAAQWHYIFRLLPSAVAGFFVALAVDRFIPPAQFKYLMAACILLTMGVMFWTERGGRENRYAERWWYGPLFGLMGGFTTMIGNAAGPVMAVYLLSVKLPKYSFVGTSAWFFLVVNYLKIPLQVFAWDNITPASLLLDALSIPFLGLGAVIGIWFVKKLPESSYRRFIIWVTVISTLMLFF